MVIGAWAVLILAALPLAPGVFRTLSPGGFSSNNLEAARADDVVGARFRTDPSNLYVIYEDPTGQLSPEDPAFEQQVQDSLATIAT